MYSQTVKKEKREEKGASVFAVWFHFGYNLEKYDFGGRLRDDVGKRFVLHRPRLECMEIDGEEFRSKLSDFDERAMARVRQYSYEEHEMCKGEEKIFVEEKDVFEEEKRENSEKSQDVFGLDDEEKDEEDLKVHTEEDKEDRASELRDPNKRPRSFDSSEDEKSEGNFKKKKK